MNSPSTSNCSGILQAGWILLAVACAICLVPFIGFFVWPFAIPLILVALILAIIAICKGRMGRGLFLLFGALFGAPLGMVVCWTIGGMITVALD